jgi:hypothetical protein
MVTTPVLLGRGLASAKTNSVPFSTPKVGDTAHHLESAEAVQAVFDLILSDFCPWSCVNRSF